MDYRHYYITKQSYNGEVIDIKYDELEGFCFKPRNKVKYEGILVNKMILVKPFLIDIMLKKKVRRKIENYLKYVIEIIDDEDEDPTNLRNALNDLTRYKSIINNNYKKHVEKEYIDESLRKIQILEKELKSKLEYAYSLELENTSKKSR
ncbi:MAG TPA: hypothetical protein GX747_04840 [Tenericutes bacterium]|nr:hypothetical protein [Mycoplasmatota bacterium]